MRKKAFGVFNRTLSRMAYSMWGTKAAHCSPGADLFAGCGFHFTLVQYQRHWLQLCAEYSRF